MNDLTLVTPPDTFYSKEYSFLLIHPGKRVKDEFQDLIACFEHHFVVYLYAPDSEEDEIPDWVLARFKQADCVIIDLDNTPQPLYSIIGYFLAYAKTYWLTNGENIFYNKLSNNRLYNLEFLKSKIGEQLEKK